MSRDIKEIILEYVEKPAERRILKGRLDLKSFKEIIDTAIEDDVEIVYVLPTYTAVFETRDYIEKVVENS